MSESRGKPVLDEEERYVVVIDDEEEVVLSTREAAERLAASVRDEGRTARIRPL